MKTKTLTLFSALTLFATLGAQAQTPNPKAQAGALREYGKLPLSFEANQGQAEAGVKFLSRGAGHTLLLHGDEAVFILRGNEANGSASRPERQLQPDPGEPANGAVLTMKILNSNRAAKVSGLDELPGKSNYFIGNDPQKWKVNVPTYAKVKYESVYPGVDLVYYDNQRQLEYDFVVLPGADPNTIHFSLRGAEKVSIDADGNLALAAHGRSVQFQRPQIYQESGGVRQEVAGNYVLDGTNKVGFRVGKYDPRKTLVIDPVLVYSTYLGGAGSIASAIAVDASGNAYVTGSTISTTFPTTSGASETKANSGSNVFISKLNSSGTALIYSTYLGGNSDDLGLGIAVDSSGQASVTGTTGSMDFPVTSGVVHPYILESSDSFVTKLKSDGSALVYSTYLGPGVGIGIAIDSSGNAYVTGSTSSANFPTTPGAFQTTYKGGQRDGFVSKLNSSGSALVYSTYIGGSKDDSGSSIVVDSSGYAYLTGTTNSVDFPVTPGVGQPYILENEDSFITKLKSDGSGLIYSTYLGPGVGTGIAIDSWSDTYLTGYTASPNFPTTPGAFQTTYGGGSYDGYITKVNNIASGLFYSTYIGGSDEDQARGIAVDSSGDAYITGLTSSANFPMIPGSFQTTYGGSQDAFVSELNGDGSALVYSTYLGGGGEDASAGIITDSSGNAFLTGNTAFSNFPTTAGAFQTSLSSGSSGGPFVAKIGPATGANLPPTTATTPSPAPNAYGWNNSSLTIALNATDNPDGPGVKQIQFSLTGPQDLNLQTVAGNAASVTVSAEGYTFLGYFATDNAGNQEISRYQIVRIDLTPPVVNVTGVSNGALYYFHAAPAPGCSTTDALSGVLTPARLAIGGGNSDDYGEFTATCSGASDEAGNAADPVTVSYTINGPTSLRGIARTEGDRRDTKELEIIIRNTGPGKAYGAEITKLSLTATREDEGRKERGKKEKGCSPILQSALPIAVGNIGPSSSAKVSVKVDFSGCKSEGSFRVDGTISANDGTTVGPIRMSDED